MEMLLERYGSTPFGTFGQLTVAARMFYTVEKPWRNNTPNVSCIPFEHYQLRWLPTTTAVPDEYGGHTWYVIGGTVGFDPGAAKRSRVAIHVGNTSEDIQGCIAVGQNLGVVNNRWGITSSRNAMLELLDIVGPEDAALTIRDCRCG